MDYDDIWFAANGSAGGRGGDVPTPGDLIARDLSSRIARWYRTQKKSAPDTVELSRMIAEEFDAELSRRMLPPFREEMRGRLVVGVAKDRDTARYILSTIADNWGDEEFRKIEL